MRPHGRARISSISPQATAVCDRCGFLYNHNRLKFQFEYAGTSLMNKKILVCERCYDKPQEQLRSIVLGADPIPVNNPRPERYVSNTTDYISTSTPMDFDPNTGIPIQTGQQITTEDGKNLTPQPFGPNTGIALNIIIPNFISGIKYGITLYPLSINGVGTDIVYMSFSSPHNLNDGDQIAIQGISNISACGIYSVSVIDQYNISYQCNHIIPISDIITSTTLVVTRITGLPYNYKNIPLTGV